jgi:hypothetical protein
VGMMLEKIRKILLEKISDLIILFLFPNWRSKIENWDFFQIHPIYLPPSQLN